MVRGKTVIIIVSFLILSTINVVQARLPNQIEVTPVSTQISTAPAPIETKPPPPAKEEAAPVYLVPETFVLQRVTSLEIAGLGGKGAEGPNGILTGIDEALPPVWQQLVVLQLEYFQQSGGHYIQGLLSHSRNPSDGGNEFPDRFLTAPSDFPASWLATGLLPFSPSPYAYELNTYSGPWGPGFVFCLFLDVSGQTWSRCLNYGGEIWRTTEWTVTD